MRIDPSIERGAGLPAPAFDFSTVKLFIGIPTRGTCATQFAVSLARTVAVLTHLGADCQFWRGESDCLVDFNRNKLLAEFMKGNFTHIWMVDDDMGFDPRSLIAMLQKNKDFIAAAGPKKGEIEEYAVKIDCHPDGTPQVFDGLFKASIVGGAFMLLKREAVWDVMRLNRDKRCEFIDLQYGYSLFRNTYTEAAFMTEDYTFCEVWRAAGKEIFIYPDVDFTHTGIKEWKGNLHRQLVNPNHPSQIPQDPMMGVRSRIDTFAERAAGGKTNLHKLLEKLRSGEIQPRPAPPPIPVELLQ